MAKISISMNDELLKKLDDYADNTYNTRSGVISQAVSSLIVSSELTAAMIDLTVAMQKVADSGTLDENTKKQLEDYERLARVLNARK